MKTKWSHAPLDLHIGPSLQLSMISFEILLPVKMSNK